MIALAGALAAVVATGAGPVFAQQTQSNLEEKAKTGGRRAQAKWESLPPARQQQLTADWKMSAAEAKTKWESLPASQQQELKGQAAAEGQKAQKKWQSLPK
jgi:hypothetical protein